MDSILSDDAFNDTACLHDRLLFHGQAYVFTCVYIITCSVINLCDIFAYSLCSPRSTIQPVKGFNKVRQQCRI